MVGYTKVTATDTEIAAFLAKKGYRPTVDRVSCDGCGKRIWGSGIGIGAHNRSKACRAEQQRQAAQAANLSENTTCTLTNECPVCAGGSICADRCATCNGTNSRMCKTHDSILLAVPPAEIIRADEITVDVAADIDAVNAEHDALMDGYVTGQPATEILTPVTSVRHAYGRSAMVCGADMELSGSTHMDRVNCEPCRQGVFGKLRAASGEPITDGMAVWDYNLNVGTVDLSTLTSDGWFNVNSPSGERMSLMNRERVTSRHPANRMLAADALSALVNVVGQIGTRETARAEQIEEAIPVEGDWIYRERDGATGRVVNVNQYGRLAIDWRNGNHTSQHWDVLQSDGYGLVTAAEYAAGMDEASIPDVPAESDDIEPCCNECVWDAIERKVWAGTGTLVKPAFRANLNRRKRKASKVSRKRNRGGK